jgi:RNA polymerase sigma-70 factor, ECF subfamily
VKDGDFVITASASATSDKVPAMVAAFAKDQQTAGDRRALFDELMATHGNAVLGFCLRMVRVRLLAEEIAQEVLVEAYRDLDRFEGRSSLRAWLLGIARHRCLDALKTQQRRSEVIESNEQAVLDFEDPGAGPIEHVDGVRLTEALEGCLKRLSPNVRATVLMRFQTESTYEELAALLAATADTLQVRVARALPVLRRCLERKGWTGE